MSHVTACECDLVMSNLNTDSNTLSATVAGCLQLDPLHTSILVTSTLSSQINAQLDESSTYVFEKTNGLEKRGMKCYLPLLYTHAAGS